jgi:hypothetical protein
VPAANHSGFPPSLPLAVLTASQPEAVFFRLAAVANPELASVATLAKSAFQIPNEIHGTEILREIRSGQFE